MVCSPLIVLVIDSLGFQQTPVKASFWRRKAQLRLSRAYRAALARDVT
jgi:hypothetical protein